MDLDWFRRLHRSHSAILRELCIRIHRALLSPHHSRARARFSSLAPQRSSSSRSRALPANRKRCGNDSWETVSHHAHHTSSLDVAVDETTETTTHIPHTQPKTKKKKIYINSKHNPHNRPQHSKIRNRTKRRKKKT